MTNRPMTIGRVRTPDAVADTPFTYCRYVGRNVIAPSIANPTMNASTTHTLNTEDRNRCSGRIGSSALASTNTKMPSDTIDADEQADDRGRSPGVLGATPGQREGETGGAQRDEHDPEVVDDRPGLGTHATARCTPP